MSASLIHILYLATETDQGTVGGQARTFREIEEAIQRSRNRDRLVMKSDWAGRKLDIARAIMGQAVPPEILHFSAGEASPNGIVMQEEHIPVQGLEELFRNYPGNIHAVLFDMSQSDAIAFAISNEVSYAIGFGGSLSSKELEAFLLGFYDELGRQNQLDIPAAFESGRIVLSLESLQAGSRDIPRLYIDPLVTLLEAMKREMQTRLREARFSENRLQQTFRSLPDAVESGGIPLPQAIFSNIREAFEFHARRLLVLGEPGSGKSLILAEFTHQMLEEWQAGLSQLIPIEISLLSWSPAAPLFDWICEQSLVEKDRFLRLFERKQLLLVLDNLDELPDHVPEANEEGELIRNYRQEFVAAWQADPRLQDLSTIISCRRADYESLTHQYTAHKLPLSGSVVIQPLEDEAIRAYLERSHASQGCEPLLAAIDRDSKLRELVRSPQFLVIVSDAFLQQREAGVDQLRKSRNLRFEAMEMFLNNRYTRISEPDIPLKDWRNLLGVAIFDLMADFYHDDTSLEIQQLESFFPDKTTSILRSHVDIAVRLHLLEPLPTSHLSYRFRNALLRDHLVLPIARKQLSSADTEDRIKAVVILGKLGDEQFVAELTALQDDPDPRLRYELGFVLGKLRSETGKSCLLKLLEDEDPDVTIIAMRSLARYGSAEPLHRIAQYLRHKDRFVRATAVLVIGELGLLVAKQDRSRLQQIADQLNELQQLDEIKEVRIQAEKTVRQLGFPAKSAFGSDMQQWIDSQEDQQQLWVAAIHILGKLGFQFDFLANSEMVLPAPDDMGNLMVLGLRQALRTSHLPGIRELAATALGNFGEEAAIPELNRSLREDPFSIVRNAAHQALHTLLTHPRVSPEKQEAVRRFLRMANYAQEQQHTPTPSTELSLEENLDILLQPDDSEIYDRFVAALAIREQCHTIPLPILMIQLNQALDDPSEVVLVAVVRVIGQVGYPDTSILKRLLDLGKSPDRLVRAEVCEALGHLFSGPYSQQSQIARLLLHLWRNDPISEVRNVALAAMMKVHHNSRHPEVHQALKRAGLLVSDPTHQQLSD